MNPDTSYSRIVPPSLQNELLVLRDAITMSNWRIGDICTEVLVHCRENQIIASKEDVYSAVACFVGKKARTVREFHHISMAYLPEHREAYGELLSYDHFRTALTFGDRWQEALEWCLDAVNSLNRPATVDMLEAHFGAPIGPDPQLPNPPGASPLWEDTHEIMDESAPAVTSNAYKMPHIENAFYLLTRLRGEIQNFPDDIADAITLLDTLESQLLNLQLKYRNSA